ncbi:MAG: type II toxin-antitoxin system RelE/ParE family toxin [Candidatus Pacearchaeota archaeon]
MVEIIWAQSFKGFFSKIKDNLMKEKIIKKIEKIKTNPEAGKPMRYGRKGTREVYIKPFRLSYSYSSQENLIYILELYHKKKQ